MKMRIMAFDPSHKGGSVKFLTDFCGMKFGEAKGLLESLPHEVELPDSDEPLQAAKELGLVLEKVQTSPAQPPKPKPTPNSEPTSSIQGLVQDIAEANTEVRITPVPGIVRDAAVIALATAAGMSLLEASQKLSGAPSSVFVAAEKAGVLAADLTAAGVTAEVVRPETEEEEIPLPEVVRPEPEPAGGSINAVLESAEQVVKSFQALQHGFDNLAATDRTDEVLAAIAAIPEPDLTPALNAIEGVKEAVEAILAPPPINLQPVLNGLAENVNTSYDTNKQVGALTDAVLGEEDEDGDRTGGAMDKLIDAVLGEKDDGGDRDGGLWGELRSLRWYFGQIWRLGLIALAIVVIVSISGAWGTMRLWPPPKVAAQVDQAVIDTAVQTAMAAALNEWRIDYTAVATAVVEQLKAEGLVAAPQNNSSGTNAGGKSKYAK